MKKIILVDGNNLLFRSFYATAYQGVIMRNSKGFPTNALYGFINMMNKIIKEENPNYIMVAFDTGKTFRHEKYDEYKAGRAAMPEDCGSARRSPPKPSSSAGCPCPQASAFLSGKASPARGCCWPSQCRCRFPATAPQGSCPCPWCATIDQAEQS